MQWDRENRYTRYDVQGSIGKLQKHQPRVGLISAYNLTRSQLNLIHRRVQQAGNRGLQYVPCMVSMCKTYNLPRSQPQPPTATQNAYKRLPNFSLAFVFTNLHVLNPMTSHSARLPNNPWRSTAEHSGALS